MRVYPDIVDENDEVYHLRTHGEVVDCGEKATENSEPVSDMHLFSTFCLA